MPLQVRTIMKKKKKDLNYTIVLSVELINRKRLVKERNKNVEYLIII
jgi:hypothetical protein